MNCKKSIDEKNITTERFYSEIEKSKNCITKCLNIKSTDFIEISDSIVDVEKLDSRIKVKCRRKLFNYGNNDENKGTLECYLSIENDFIEIFHHPN